MPRFTRQSPGALTSRLLLTAHETRKVTGNSLIIMSDLIRTSKKVFTFGVVVTTILWSLGVAALVPGVANADPVCPTLRPGDQVKVTGFPHIYAVNNNNQVMSFGSGYEYKTWRTDESYGGYISITDACYQTLASPSAQPLFVNFRPGSNVIRRQSSNDLHVVLPNNTKAKITQEAARALYGANFVAREIPVERWGSYINTGADITTAVAHEGMLVRKDGKVWYVAAGNVLREVTSSGMVANRFKSAFVRNVAASAVVDYTTGEQITAEVAVVADRTQSGGVSSSTTTSTTTSTSTVSTTTPVVAGSLAVALAADTPAGRTVPKSATNVNVLKFNATAGSSNVVLDEVVVRRNGVGSTTGITLYLYDGETRVGTGKTVASDTNEAVFSALNATVTASQTRTFTLRLATGSSVATGEHSFSVTAVRGSVSSTSVSGALPLVGSTFSVNSSISAGTVTVAGNGTLTNPVLGDLQATVAQFKLTAGTEDIDVNSFTLYQNGTLGNDMLSNFSLYQGATQAPATVTVNGRYVTFALATPYRIVNGNNKIFAVKTDVSASAEAGKTAVFYMNDDNDIRATGSSYGFGVSVTRSSYDAAATGEGQTLTLQGGGVTIANRSQSAHDAKVDSTEVELGKVGITARTDAIEIQKMRVTIATAEVPSSSSVLGTYGTFRDIADDGDYDSGTDTLLLRNIKLKDADTGRTVGSAKALTDATGFVAASTGASTTLNFDWTDYFTIARGATRNVVVVADINSAQVSGVVYTATFDFSSSTYFTVKDSRDVAVTDIVPFTTIASNGVTTRSSALTISRATTPESRTVVKGSTVDALGMIFSAGSGSGNDVKISGLTLNVYVDNVGTTDGTFVDTTEGTVDANEVVTEVNLYVGDVKIAGPASVDSSGNAVFNSSKFVGGFYTIPAGQSKTIIARALVSGNAPYGGDDDRFSFTFAAADVTAEDGTGSSLTPTVNGTNLNGTTAPSVYVQVTGNGTITSSADSGRPSAQLLLAGITAEQEVHRVRLVVAKEAFTVDKLAVQVSQSGSFDNVDYVKLYDTSGNALSGQMNLDSDGKAVFTGLSINVPLGGITVVVKAKLNAMGERTVSASSTAGVGSDSGDSITFILSTSSTDFHAIGAASGVVDTGADAAAGNAMVVRKSKPTITVLTLPSVVLANGTNVIFKFSVAADANEDITLARITPYITFSDSDSGNELFMNASTTKLYDITSGATLLNNYSAGNAIPAGNSSSTGNLGVNIDSGLIVTIAKGTARTFELRADFTGVETNDSVSVRFDQDTAALSGTTMTGAAAIADTNSHNFIWTDNGADVDGYTSQEWINSYQLLNWDSRSLYLSKS